MFAFIQNQTQTSVCNLDGDVLDTLRNDIPNLQIETVPLSQGTYSIVYSGELRLSEETSIVVKVQSVNLNNFDMQTVRLCVHQFDEEVGIMSYLQDYNLSPRVYRSGFYYNTQPVIRDNKVKPVIRDNERKADSLYHYIIMERLSIVTDLLRQNTPSSLTEIVTMAVDTSDQMLSYGVCHRDYTLRNLGYRVNNNIFTLVPFDFGLSRYTRVIDDSVTNVHIERIRLYSTLFCDVNISDVQTLIDIIRIPEIPIHTIKNRRDAERVYPILNSKYLELYNSTLSTEIKHINSLRKRSINVL